MIRQDFHSLSILACLDDQDHKHTLPINIKILESAYVGWIWAHRAQKYDKNKKIR